MVNDLAFPLPVTVIAELLGLPVEDQLKFKAWSIPAVKAAEAELHGMPVPPEQLAAVAELEAYLLQMANARKADPRADLVSGLVVPDRWTAFDGRRDRQHLSSVAYCWL